MPALDTTPVEGGYLPGSVQARSFNDSESTAFSPHVYLEWRAKHLWEDSGGLEALSEPLSEGSLRIGKYRQFSKVEAMWIYSLGLDMIIDFIH